MRARSATCVQKKVPMEWFEPEQVERRRVAGRTN